MHDLASLLNSISTNSCPNRQEAKRDIQSGISMNSEVVLRNFLSIWLLTPESELAKMSTQDMQYRQFIVEFEEKYNGQN